jgi:hypothetical protein
MGGKEVDRPYFSHSTKSIADEAEAKCHDFDALMEIVEELGHRSRPNARALRVRVEERIEELESQNGIFTRDELNDPGLLLDFGEYRTARYAQFSLLSERVRRLKGEKRPEDVEFFLGMLGPLINGGYPICIVPSHTPGNENSGMALLARALARRVDGIDGTGVLVRHQNIHAAHEGGGRDIERHLSSVEVVYEDLIFQQDVLLLDDICTTGNSLEACRRLLLEAGAAEVHCLVLAKTANPRVGYQIGLMPTLV